MGRAGKTERMEQYRQQLKEDARQLKRDCAELEAKKQRLLQEIKAARGRHE